VRGRTGLGGSNCALFGLRCWQPSHTVGANRVAQRALAVGGDLLGDRHVRPKAETLRAWVRRAAVDGGVCSGVTTVDPSRRLTHRPRRLGILPEVPPHQAAILLHTHFMEGPPETGTVAG
jgi:hypothetical protein